ncbi:MAG: enoyl-CoA hydratase/isomerase family protein [Candidatus Aminicenantes bacterium]|nr:enoyl-CoA hydratase/isomerase family protein [Candidatus Aminicenantes bacterium]
MDKSEFKTIIYERRDQVAWVTFNRPEVHNAFNARLIEEMTGVVKNIRENDAVRIMVLTGKGKSFCAGADLNWLREIIDYSYEKNLEESRALAEVLHQIYALPKPTIALVNGTAIGGGTGFLSACDMAVAAEEAAFGLSEVKIGLVPAAISPYVIRKIGESKAREYFLTGKRISARKALELGLVNEVVPLEKLSEAGDLLTENLLASGPEAIANCKELITTTSYAPIADVKEYTARMIAGLRVSKEGQEGMASFLEKRKPNWIKTKT